MATENEEYASIGCHEEFDVVLEVSELKKKVEHLESYIGHMNWHLSIYRSALLEVPGGHDVLHRKLEEYDGVLICPSCEKDTLLARINSLEKRDQTSPILVGTKRRRKSKTD